MCQAQSKLIQIGRVVGKKFEVEENLLSRKYFWSKNVFGLKKSFGSKKKRFGSKQVFGKKKFLSRKKVLDRKNFGILSWVRVWQSEKC